MVNQVTNISIVITTVYVHKHPVLVPKNSVQETPRTVLSIPSKKLELSQCQVIMQNFEWISILPFIGFLQGLAGLAVLF